MKMYPMPPFVAAAMKAVLDTFAKTLPHLHVAIVFWPKGVSPRTVIFIASDDESDDILADALTVAAVETLRRRGETTQ
jgi:hypothetical protein